MLTIEADVPIAISDPGDIPLKPDSNLQVIRALNLLALSQRSDAGDSAVIDGHHDLSRLEAKVDMLLALVGSLIAEKSALPPVRTVRFSGEKVTVGVEQSFSIDQVVLLTIYPNPELPRPLIFKAIVSAFDAASIDSPGQLELTLVHPEPNARDEFERYIFLRHRRERTANAPS